MNAPEIIHACYEVVRGVVTNDRTRKSITGSVMLKKVLGDRIHRALKSGARPAPDEVVDRIKVEVKSPRSDGVYSVSITGIPLQGRAITMTMRINLRKQTISRVK